MNILKGVNHGFIWKLFEILTKNLWKSSLLLDFQLKIFPQIPHCKTFMSISNRLPLLYKGFFLNLEKGHNSIVIKFCQIFLGIVVTLAIF
jgi:hypothetical protein